MASKKPCSTCDKKINDHETFCRDCKMLETFSRLPDIDSDKFRRSEGNYNFTNLPDIKEPREDRFLCLSDGTVLAPTDIDASGRVVVGHDRWGYWVGTDRAPMILSSAELDSYVVVYGEYCGEEWAGYYLGTEREAMRAARNADVYGIVGCHRERIY